VKTIKNIEKLFVSIGIPNAEQKKIIIKTGQRCWNAYAWKKELRPFCPLGRSIRMMTNYKFDESLAI
jgi:hypothetical protein